MNNATLHVARQWLAAFNDHNLEKLLALYADDAVHYSPKLKQRKPETGGMLKGKHQLAEWWKEAFEQLPGLNYEPTSLTANRERVFMEYTRKVPGQENVAVAEVLEIKNDLIVASRVYHG
jgi:hypothetical protein